MLPTKSQKNINKKIEERQMVDGTTIRARMDTNTKSRQNKQIEKGGSTLSKASTIDKRKGFAKVAHSTMMSFDESAVADPTGMLKASGFRRQSKILPRFFLS